MAAAVSANDVQRLFLQAVLSRGFLSAKLAQTLWAQSKEAVTAVDDNLVFPHSGERAEWDAFVAQVNEALNPLDLEFRHSQDEINGHEMYAIVNCKDDAIAQMATDYTPGEIAFFKAMVEQIMLAPRSSFSISSLAALREISALKPKSNMSKTQAEIVLASFVAKGWLLKSKRGRYSLSTRALLELQTYLKSTYPDEILECVICLELLTKGVACPTANCQVRMHYHCFKKWMSRHHACTTCNNNWPADTANMSAIGEAAVRDGEDGKRRVRKTVENSDDEDDDEDMDEDEPSQPRTQQSRKGKGKQAADESMDVDQNEEDDSDTPVKKAQGKRRGSRRS